MTRPSSPHAIAAPAVVVLLTAVLAGLPMPAAAQQTSDPAEVAEPVKATRSMEVPVLPTERRQVGDATRHLLAMQREGYIASTTPRPLAGDVASLSYQRYLDSFKFPIPEKFSTTVSRSGAAGGSVNK